MKPSTRRKLFPILLGTLAVLATLNIASASDLQTIYNYQSTVSTDANGPLDLKAQLYYDNANQNMPIAVLMHAYSASNTFGSLQVNAERLRDLGFFVVAPSMRGRDGSDGARDSGGLEIYDIYDAVEAIKAQYPQYVDSDTIYISGYSGGGGNTMSAITKFPDYFTAAAGYFGMADYGYHSVNGWYVNGAGSRISQLKVDIGDPTTGDNATLDKYLARASNYASKNVTSTEVHLFVNENETICPPVNSQTFKSYADSTSVKLGEFDNITCHIGVQGTYEDFDGDGVDDPDEQQWWVHGYINTTVQAAGEGWFMDRLLAGQIARPSIKDSDQFFVAGFVKTKQFGLWLGDGQNAAGTLDYSLSGAAKSFSLALNSHDKDVKGTLTVDLSNMPEAPITVKLNGQVIDTLTDTDTFEYDTFGHNDLLELIAQIPGDANNDGHVDGSDVTILAGNWQVTSGATWEMGDFNNDGRVDGSDVTILAGNWQYGASTTATAVPEPSTFVLLTLGTIALMVSVAAR